MAVVTQIARISINAAVVGLLHRGSFDFERVSGT